MERISTTDNTHDQLDISIIIPSKNGIKAGIEKCLNGVFAQKTSASLEVVLVDSGSTDGTLDVIPSFPGIRLIQIRPEEFRHGRTRNLGAKKARGRFLVFLNQDAWPADENWLAGLIADFEGDKEVAGVFSRQVPKEGAPLFVEREMGELFPQVKCVRSKEDFEEAVSKKADLFRSQLKKTIQFSTVSAAIRRDVFDKYPFSDEILFAEDQEWAKRVLQAGYKIVYEPNSRVCHSHVMKLHEYFNPNDLSVAAYNKILGRGIAGPIWALPYLFVSLFTKTFVDVPYIWSKKLSLWKKTGESLFAVLARILMILGKTISLFKIRH